MAQSRMIIANRPTREEAEEAIRTLLRWAGDDPSREGLLDTPARVARAWKEYCQGYEEDPAYHLSRRFEEVGGYNELVLLKDIPFQSHCEHHMAPFFGRGEVPPGGSSGEESDPASHSHSIGWQPQRRL